MTDELIQAKAEELAAEASRRMGVTEFANGLKDHGTPARGVVALLMSMPPEKAGQVQNLLTRATGKLVDFSAHGHGKILQSKQTLPDEYKPILRQFIADGKTIEAWFAANRAEVGDMADFDLSDFDLSEFETK